MELIFMQVFYPGHNARANTALTLSKESCLAICYRNAIAGAKVID